MGVVGVRRIASEFADIWSTLLADVKHVALADRLFQKTTKAGQFDISTSMLFLTDPKYHVRIVHGLRNHFPNTMFGGVLLWTLIELLLRNMRSLYALWRQKRPLTNGQVQEAKTHCRKIGEAWLRLGWKSTGQEPIVERCSKSIVTFMCSAVYPRNTGISLSNLVSKTACVGGASAAHAFHHVVSPCIEHGDP